MSVVPLIISMSLTIILVLISRKEKYIKEQEKALKDDYTFKDMLFVGFFIIDKVGIDKFKKLSNDAYGKIVSMYGLEGDENFRYYISNKFILSLIVLNIVYFFQTAEGNFSILFTLGGIIASVGMFFISDTMINEKFEKRSISMKYEFPEFVSKLTLLINAGLTFENALGKVIESNEKSNALYYELEKTYRDIKGNIPRDKCLIDFSRRCKISELTKFTTIVLQNINKGTTDLCDALNLLSGECWENRKMIARKKGEEASSKLLFPMMVMLIAIFIIILVPTFMSMFTNMI